MPILECWKQSSAVRPTTCFPRRSFHFSFLTDRRIIRFQTSAAPARNDLALENPFRLVSGVWPLLGARVSLYEAINDTFYKLASNDFRRLFGVPYRLSCEPQGPLKSVSAIDGENYPDGIYLWVGRCRRVKLLNMLESSRL